MPDADPSDLPRDYRKAIKIAVALAALFGPPFFYVYGIDRTLKDHLAEVEATRPLMFDFACSTARNVYKLCMRSGVECEPVSATCKGDR